MANIVENKYYLKTVHEEIGLFDRKLAHLLKYDVFESDEARDAAVRKLARKRETLVETAKRMAAEGVEFKPSDLPPSIRPEGMEVPAAVEPVQEVAVEAEAAGSAGVGANRSARRQSSVYAGTSLDWEQSVRNYMQSKTKA
jgi:hypothetical protein